MIQVHAESKNGRIVFLDYLRIFAFVSVLIGHKFYPYLLEFIDDKSIHATPRMIVELIMPLFYGGGAGVVVFFLVSGYIISHVLQVENEREFLIKRIFRIYPLYIVAVIAQYIPLIIAGYDFDKGNFLLQLLLIGDFFGVPHSLGGVEWTLRIEILFYVFMACLKSWRLMDASKIYLPYVFFGVVFVCIVAMPFPSFEEGTYGYFSIYFPFLLLGAMFYFYEKKTIAFPVFLCFIFAVFSSHFYLIGLYQKFWLGQHFALFSFLIFAVSWIYKSRLRTGAFILFLSDLTYAVYLFHNWLFDLFKKRMIKFGFSDSISNLLALLILLFVCYLAVRYVEKPAVRLGQVFLKKLNARV